MNCPSCDAPIDYDQRFAKLLVCEYCKAAMTFDTGIASICGEMSVLATPSGPVFTGAMGQMGRHGFQVIGRVRYGYMAGFWEEWYLQLEDGTTAWFTEDEKRFMLEHPVVLDISPDDVKAVSAGNSMELGSHHYTVRETGTAVCEGGEGQLPFRIISGEEVYFLDLVRDDGVTATIELEPDGEVKLFEGQAVDLNDLTVSNAQESRGTADFESDERDGQRERISYSEARLSSVQCLSCGSTNQDIDWDQAVSPCASCGTPLGKPAGGGDCPGCGGGLQCMSPDAASIVCQYCGSTSAVSGAGESLLFTLKKKERKKKDKSRIRIPLGSWATFDGDDFQLVGFLTYREVDDGVYYSDEYLYYSKTYGYRWLSCYEGHFSLEEKITGALKTDFSKLSTMRPRSSVKEFGRSWKLYESGDQSVDWVEGELPWVAQKGDSLSYIELTSPPYLLSVEQSATEAEWAQYRYMDHGELKKCLHLESVNLPAKRGIGACQPNTNFWSGMTLAAVALLFAFFSFVGCSANALSGSEINTLTVTAKQYGQEYLTEPFEIKKSGFHKVEFSAPVDNSWVWMDVALIDKDEKALLDFSGNMSYYHGRDSEGTWTEGSRTDKSLFRVDQPGTYRFLVLGSAGKGSSSTVTTATGEAVTLKIYDGVRLSRYYALFFFVALGFSVICLFSPLFFEGRRWKHLYEE